MGLFPPGTRGGYDFILQASSVSLGRLCIEWVIVVLITGGLIYTLKVDPDLMLKIPCLLLPFLLSSLSRPLSYQEFLKDAKDAKKYNHHIVVFWVIVVAFLLLAIVAIRLSIPTRWDGIPRGAK